MTPAGKGAVDPHRLKSVKGRRNELDWHEDAIPRRPEQRDDPGFLQLENLEPLLDELRELAADRRTSAAARGEPGLLGIDLFCGAGGLSLGFEEAGIDIVVGVDSDQNAVRTHRQWFPGLTLNWDLEDDRVVEAVVELMTGAGLDVLTGGPPCQPFSRAGRALMRSLVNRGIREADDPRAGLWETFLEIAQRAEPKAVIMENVPDMALDDEMLILRTMVEQLEAMDYRVHTRIIAARDHGVPQIRERLFLVALRGGGGSGPVPAFQWPSPQDEVTLDEAIGDLGKCEAALGWDSDVASVGCHYPGPRRHDTPGRRTFSEKMREGVGIDDEHLVHDHVTRAVREDDRRAFETMTPETKYSDLEETRYRTDIFNDKYKRLDPTVPSRTITAHLARDGYWYIHPDQHRTITIREAARIQSFRDWFRFHGAPTQVLRQIGNAVPPALGNAIGGSVRESLSLEPSEEPGPVPGDRTTRETVRRLAGWVVDCEQRLPGVAGTAGLDPSWRTQWAIDPIRRILGQSAGGVLREDRRDARWRVLVGETFLGVTVSTKSAVDPEEVADSWDILEPHVLSFDQVADGPENLRIAAREAFRILERPGRKRGSEAEDAVERLIDLAVAVRRDPEVLDSVESLGDLDGVGPGTARTVFQLTPFDGPDYVTVEVGSLRVAARVLGREDPVVSRAGGGGPDWHRVRINRKLTDGRISIARLIGIDPLESAGGSGDTDGGDRPPAPVERYAGQLAKIALLELSRSHCLKKSVHCRTCPLREVCASADQNQLFDRQPSAAAS